jgi:23S rRNA (uracil1939-C5)-methyltransferase
MGDVRVAFRAGTCFIPAMRSKGRPSLSKPPAVTRQLSVRALGAQGDGIADTETGPVYIPFTLPGESVTADVQETRGRLVSIDVASPDRAAAKCPHYTVCGGCSLQHLGGEAYLAFKRSLVTDALLARDVETDVDPVISLAPRTRRRATLAAARTPKGFLFGFHGRRTHEIVPITDCAVLTPALMAALPKIENLARIAAPQKGPLVVTATETATGVDVAFTGVGKWFSADDRMRLVEATVKAGLARISVDGEVVLERSTPTLRMGDAFLTPPPGGFLQATEPSEAAMVRLVIDAVGDARKIADLFAGAGTFSLPLAQRASVHAVESDAPSLAALTQAARKTATLKPVTTERRDLFRQPLTKEELKRFDAVVMDPPRAGAEAQAANLAASKVGCLAMISCSAITFARDVRVLIDGGWRIDRVTPIDQFLWSPHVEAVALLEKPRRRRARP